MRRRYGYLASVSIWVTRSAKVDKYEVRLVEVVQSGPAEWGCK
ncbi:hypothetical protein OOU_Y34scaffold00228g52 [Pyricularia oryzae Y34]|uniref:Uncharacterized protein n=2 Tax=Pyricularia oryzae TaxID=318829 RepID=A0AA97P572_PYRO3|nr:hypothetical protein OOU_Y34scaffold00228g52 [Pyricularia oryzae Y34]